MTPGGAHGGGGTGPHPTERLEPTWLLVLTLSAIYTVAFVDRNVISLLVEPIERTLGVGDLAMSLVLGLGFSVFTALVNIPAGLAVDRFGRRGLIAGAALFWSAMTILSGLSRSFGALLLCRMGVGLSEAFIAPAAFSLVRDRVAPRFRGRAFGAIGLAPSLGAALSFLVGGALVGASERGAFAGLPVLGGLRGWQIVLVVIGTIGLSPAALLWLLHRDTRRDGPAVTTIRAQFTDAWRHIAAEKRSYAPLIAYACAGAMIATGYFSWLAAMLGRSFELPVARIGAITGPILLVASALGLSTCGLALDALARRERGPMRYGLPATAVATLACAATPLAASATEAFALVALAAFFLGNFYPLGAALLARHTPARLMGSTTAIYLLFVNLGSGIGPTIVSLLSTRGFAGSGALGRALALYCLVVGACGLAAGALMRPAPIGARERAAHGGRVGADTDMPPPTRR